MFAIFVQIATEDSMREIWQIITWSLFWLYRGKWPQVKWDGAPWTPADGADYHLAGTPLADGLFFLLDSIKGDLDYFTKNLKLRHYNSNLMCDICPATRCRDDPSMMYNNFGAGARWMFHKYTPDQWRACYDGKFLHWVFTLPGVSNLSLDPDELHVWHLGALQYMGFRNDGPVIVESGWSAWADYYPIPRVF